MTTPTIRQTVYITIQELITLQNDREYYIWLGYPTDIANQRAWNHLYASRRGAKLWQ